MLDPFVWQNNWFLFYQANPLIKTGGDKAITAISAAPFGSALACLISYGYIKMLGAEGLTKLTKIAILNANYIKHRLQGNYDTLYSGECEELPTK